MSVESSRAAVEKFIGSGHTDVSMLSDDVVFTLIGMDQEYSTPQGVLGMLNHFYRTVFDAHAEVSNMVVDENKVAVEGLFVGKHTGEFAGIPATGNMVRVPIAVFYDLENGIIRRTRVHMDMASMMAQLGVGAPSAAQA